jgi:hypothetical protein
LKFCYLLSYLYFIYLFIYLFFFFAGQPKCEQYWPKSEGSSQTFGRYTVTFAKVTERAHFIHRVLEVSKEGEQVG